jgi:hypothetical protein
MKIHPYFPMIPMKEVGEEECGDRSFVGNSYMAKGIDGKMGGRGIGNLWERKYIGKRHYI